jgi:O-antigen/teichoic acid export membrane protein
VSRGYAVGERAILNTLYRSGSEIIGRFASLLLFVVAGRKLGQNGLGAFVVAVAYLGFVMVAVDLGLDRYILRIMARDRAASERLFFNVLALKLALALPLFAAGFVVLDLLGYPHQVQATAWALAPGVFSDSIARTQLSVFLAHERGGPPSLADGIQRVCSAALGIAALGAGLGVVSVAASYSIGSMIGVAIGFFLLARTVGMPSFTLATRGWRRLAVSSVPFATQDTFTVILARADALILSLSAGQAAVGRYGAAYRLFESTLLITYALGGAFAAMFTYLGPNTEPPLRAVFQRSIKLALVLLAPVAVAFGVFATPICRLIYGSQFASAGVPLRILAPAIVLIGVATLANSLMLSRGHLRAVVSLAAGMAGVNVALNLILIPLYSDAGAAAAMLITEVIYGAWILRISTRAVGGISWLTTAAGAVLAGATMTAVTLALNGTMWLALTLGAAVYALVLFGVERVVSPADARFLAQLVRRRLLSRPTP